ncbi:MAG: hypothetical protein PHX13_11750, partial [Thiovulaceae bacterium]|nr:hypothetical protein [Sulfurimonadaceae bacterium]
MKYILPLVLSLFFAACNDSDQKAETSANTNITPQTQTITPVQAEKMPLQEEKAPIQAQKVSTQPIAGANTTEVSGEAIFNKCKSCHGNNAEKKALGASRVIEGWEV